MSDETNHVPQDNETCPAVGYQAVNVNVPVTVTPYAKAGTTVTKCCGSSIVKPGKSIGQGTKNGICNFTIGQNIVVAIPVAFGADASVGDTYVDCLGASAEEIDCDTLVDLGDPNQPESVPAAAVPPAPAAPAAAPPVAPASV